jgi:hypothetical protein
MINCREYWADVSRPEWGAFVAGRSVLARFKRGGRLLSRNADVYYLYPSDAFYQGLVSMIGCWGSMRSPILVQWCDVFVSKAVLDATEPLSCITGVNQECVFTNINFSDGTLIRQNTETKRYYQDYSCALQKSGPRRFPDGVCRRVDRLPDRSKNTAKKTLPVYISGSVD